jgi:cytochrome bd-type quinol oxidase subunit 2
MSALWTIIVLAVVVLSIAGLWMMFQKAGEAGWKSIIPIWNTLVILKMVGREWWWIILLIIPIVGFVVWIIVMNDLSKSFGHGVGFTLGLIFLSIIFLFILAFGSSMYRGPAGATGTSIASPPPPPPPMPA